MDRVIWSERPDHFWRQITKTVSSRPFFSNSQSIISWTDLRISVPMTFMRSPALRRFFYIKKKQTFLEHFFQIRGPLSQERTWGFRFRWHLWGPQSSDDFSILKKKIFFGPFFSKFAVHYLRNGPEDFGSDDIYEVPSPQTIFLY